MAIVLKRASRLPFAPIVAGLFALSAAVLVMATPGWLLEVLVEKTGIASVLSAAAPPLGMKARALMAILAALGTGLVFWIGLTPFARLLDRKPKTKFKRDVAPSVDQASDSPVDLDSKPVSDDIARRLRRPIFADRELGAPFMSKEALAFAPILAPSEIDPVAPDELMLDMSYAQGAEEPALTLDPPAHVVDDQEVVEPFAPEAYAPVAFDLPPADNFVMPPAPVSTGPVSAAPEFVAADFAAAAPTIPVLPPYDAHSGESIAEMVERLERGLERRSAAISAARAAADAAVAVQAVEAAAPAAYNPAQASGSLAGAQREVDSALQQALNTLERLAAGGR